MEVKISVITPSFNSEKFIQRAIDSVIMQGYPNFEHIVIDGGSTDTTVAILKKYPEIKWISEIDEGQSDAMNKGFEMASGELIVYLNSDDYFLPNTFRIVSNYYSEHDSDVIVGNLCLVQRNETRLDYSEWKFSKIIFPRFFGFPYNPVTYFYKRRVQEEVGLFPKTENNVMDYWFLIRAFESRKVSKLNHVFGVFFLHEDCKSFNFDSRKRRQEVVTEFLEAKSLLYRVCYSAVSKFYYFKCKL